MFTRIGQFIYKILILEYWYFSMAARTWSNNSNITLTCWRITNFNFFVDCSHICFDFFWHVSGLAFLLSLNFLFTLDYYISAQDEIFHITAIFFNSVYLVEISAQDENIYIISPLVCTRIFFIRNQWKGIVPKVSYLVS